MYINSINYFRGISIIFIVFGHCLGLADFMYDSMAGNTLWNLTLGGTYFFVFISGFLFHHIFYQKFEFKKFMIRKIKYVLCPYLILSTLPILYLILRICIASIFSPSSFTYYYEALLSIPLFRIYVMGVGFYGGYWFIPFIMIIFALSPIFVRFIKLKLKAQIITILFLLICSVFIHRGTYQNVFSVFQNVLNFTPIYLIGIISSEKKDIIYSKIKGREFYILSLVITLAIFQAYIGRSGGYFKDPFTFGGINFIIIQKILFCFFFMIWLNRFEKYKLKLLKIFAENSFGIYFTHGIIIIILSKIKYGLGISFTSNSFIIYCLVTMLVFFLSISVTLFVKRLFPKHSRYLVGS
ncbi:acyltransferase family protein [Algoriphagus aquimarinus]|uniref:Acyltransferase n=1 Tax=Algoriphagus aquimarinus TaxID=237018 RepID=A0A5C7AAW4_9BACT|nr:acyltransferase [Algoriphagus aquimarinus]TXE01841.1 acyltransferase [Algoriphagus aquimarinus]